MAFALAAALLIAPAQTRAADVTIDPATTFQTIDGFGSCLAWWVNDPNASIYYNPTFRSLYAKDLGFNMLRVEMHTSALMGPGGTLSSPVDLVDDLNSNIAKLNMARREVAVYGDLAAYLRDNVLDPGSFKLVGAFWSPPHWLKGPTGTKYWTGDAAPWAQGDSNTAGGRLKQDAASKTQFARYAAAWIKGFEQRYGVTWAGVSLQNELIFETAYNSATYYKNEAGENGQFWQYADMLRAVADYFNAKGVTTKIMGPHHSHIAGRPGNPWHFGVQMSFIDAVRNHASGNLMNEIDIIASNDYVDEGMQNHAVMMRAYWEGRSKTSAAWQPGPEGNVSQYGKPNWYQETSGESTAWDKDNALGLALRYQNALVQGGASAYIYWQTADDAAEPSAQLLLGSSQLQNPHASKKYCAVKHFSRYIRPGSKRVKATFDQSGWAALGGANQDDTYNSLNVSAYVKGGDLTVVLVNMRSAADTTNVKIPSSLGISSLQQFRTSASESFATQANLAVSNGQVSVSVPPLSVVTLYGRGGGGTPAPTPTPSPSPNPNPTTQSLTVGKAGTGSGTVTSSPAGISCGTVCSASYANGTSVTLTASPASGSTFGGWSGACSGTGSCTVAMSSARSVTATFAAASNPGGTTATYGNGGNPWAVGAATRRIEAENYDTGGEGAGYHDASPGNSGGQYRNDDVDLEPASAGGYDVGWVAPGEWLQYTVDVAAAGSYELTLHVARKVDGSQGLKVLAGGSDVTGELAVPATGAWQTWVDVKKTVTLAAGRQQLRVVAVGSEFNLDWLELKQGSGTTTPPPAGRQTYGNGGGAWSIGSSVARIEAENYDAGGEGVAFHDSDGSNSGGACRKDAVDLEAASGGGYNVGWIAGGEWLEYSVNVAKAGNYDVSLRVARLPAGSAAVRVLFGGADKTGDLAVPSTAGWQNWTTVTKTVSLAAGPQLMRVGMRGSEFNVDWVEVKPSTSTATPPTEPPPSTSGLTVYDDALASDWSDWSWTATTNVAATSPVKSGSKAITATLGGYGALSLRKGVAQSTSGYTALRFWVHGGTGSAKALRVFTYTADGSGTSPIVHVNAPANTWTEVRVPLLLLGNPASIKRIAIQEHTGMAQPAIAVDDIRLVP